MRLLLCVPGGAVRVHKQPRDNWKIAVFWGFLGKIKIT